MDERKNDSLKIWTPLLFAVIMIAGMTIGFKLRDSLRAKRDIETIIYRNDRLEQLIDLINEKYVDTVDLNSIYQDAVTGILSHLDPHTVYISADQVENVNEDLEGGFYGIGVEFVIVRDTIQVTSVMPGGPAERVNVQVGDQLVKVGDSIVAGKKISSGQIIKMLKGKQHTKVMLTLKQPFVAGTRKVEIERDIVPILSVDAGIMLDANTGYIKINRFSATTYDEFTDALTKLKRQNMEDLILDLRDNPGGYLDAATLIADELISGRKLLVYTQGKRSYKTEYKAGDKNGFENGRLVVLVDENSASASEILAGAVQDWDRGVIVGRRTFGKGLVQEQYDLGDGAALRLTIAKYYTPSGRCIQRTYAKGKSAYTEDYYHRFQTGELMGFDTLAIGDTIPYYTANKRVVYGGGGIKPDVYIPYDTTRIAIPVLSMLTSDALSNIMWDYYLRNRDSLRYRSLSDFEMRFRGEDTVIAMYLRSLPVSERKDAETVLKTPVNNQLFRLHMKAQFARYMFKGNGYYQVLAQDDDEVQRALQILSDKSYLKIIGR
ncbi:MAG TPA: S41 family peptidase [Flavipsychrobacter sp.]|nr:S41 family peptidase [Flavipsychrobacter sp.]